MRPLCWHLCTVISQGENLLVPLHAYPIMNETKFPKRIDFGRVMLGDCVTKRVKMECKVPIEFEYEINMVKPNAAFRVRLRRVLRAACRSAGAAQAGGAGFRGCSGWQCTSTGEGPGCSNFIKRC